MLNQVTKAIDQHLKPIAYFGYILGSIGTPRFHSKSDIDIAVFFKSDIDEKSRFDLMNKLESELHRDVQIVPLNSIDPIFARQVMETGRLVFNNNAEILLKWQSKQMSIYPDFKRSREIIEKSLMNRKKYG